jgi:hypothetical protein
MTDDFITEALSGAYRAGCTVEPAQGAPRRKQLYFAKRVWRIDGKLHLFYDGRSGRVRISWDKASRADFVDFFVQALGRTHVLVVPKEIVLAERKPGSNFTFSIRLSDVLLWHYEDRWLKKVRKAA